MQPPSSEQEVQPNRPPEVSIPQVAAIDTQAVKGIFGRLPAGQFVRYLCIGVMNSLFGYAVYVALLTLLNAVLSARWLYLTVVLATVLAMPLNISFAYFGYKFFVFRTKGNYLREWLKCFAVYSTGIIPGLVVLSALTRILQSAIHNHAAWLHLCLNAVERHLSGRPLALIHYVATGKAMAGYIAGAIVMGVTTVYSFVAHKNITFRTKSAE